MKKSYKITLIIFSLIFTISSAIYLFHNITKIIEVVKTNIEFKQNFGYEFEYLQQNIRWCCFNIFYDILALVAATLVLIFIFKNISVKKIFYPAKYTYEEYKAIMDKKKAQKQEKKKQKLQRQLNSLDKTE